MAIDNPFSNRLTSPRTSHERGRDRRPRRRLGRTALLVSPWSRVLGAPGRVTTALAEQAVLWLLFAAVLAIVRLWGNSRASLWLRPFRWHSIGWGLLLVAAFALVILPCARVGAAAAGLPGYAGGMEQVLALPLWLRVLAVIERASSRKRCGYALTRLTLLTGHVCVAAALALIVFCALHVPSGAAAPLWRSLSAECRRWLFVLARILAMMVAHLTIDAWDSSWRRCSRSGGRTGCSSSTRRGFFRVVVLASGCPAFALPARRWRRGDSVERRRCADRAVFRRGVRWKRCAR